MDNYLRQTLSRLLSACSRDLHESNQMKTQLLREVFKVTEWREGCVYRTKSVGYAWVTDGVNPPDKDTQYHSVSTTVMRHMALQKRNTIRRVADDANDIIMIDI